MGVGKVPLPTSEDLISGFVATLAMERLIYALICSYLSAIRYHQIFCGHGDPGIPQMSRLEYVLKGIQKDEAYNQATGRSRDRQPLAPKRCYGFGFLRVGEFTSPSSTSFDKEVYLSLGDISVDDSPALSMLFVRLKQSKTDQLRRGVTVTIVLGKSEQFPLCPLSAMLW
jgi:hypothetical protein